MAPLNDLLPQALFAPLAGLVLLLVLAAPLQAFLMLDLALAFLPGHWLVGGVRVDPGDLAICGLLLAMVLRGRFGAGDRSLLRLPGLRLWLALGLALCVAYLMAPGNQAILTGPLRIEYQLYRYCWKTILYFPLAALLLGDTGRTWLVLDAVLLGGDVCAGLGLSQGLKGLRAQGPFDSPNTLGALLILPMLIAIAGLLSEHGRMRKLLYLVSLLLLGRVMLYSGSRGALMAVCLGTALLLWQSLRQVPGRRRLRSLAPWAFAAAAVTLAVHPSVLNGPNVQRFLTLAHPLEEDTFRWRMQERWPHFWAKVEAHPWVGVGTYVDPSLGTTGNTPHNGYIAIAVASGLPALALYLALGGLAFHRAWRRLKQQRLRRSAAALAAARATGTGASAGWRSAALAGTSWRGAAGATRASGTGGVSGRPMAPMAPAAGETDWLLDALVAAGLAGLLVHNFDDIIVLLPAVSKEFWLLIGLALAPPVTALAGARAAAGTRWPRGEAARTASAAGGAAGQAAASPAAASAGSAPAAAAPAAAAPSRAPAAGPRPAAVVIAAVGSGASQGRVRP
jgi:O-antigen ligase